MLSLILMLLVYSYLIFALLTVVTWREKFDFLRSENVRSGNGTSDIPIIMGAHSTRGNRNNSAHSSLTTRVGENCYEMQVLV